MISSIVNLVYELPHELPNLRLKKLGNTEILRKSQIWVETYPSAHSPFHKLNFGNSSLKTRKSRFQTFLVLSSFTGFLYFVPYALSRVVDHSVDKSNLIFRFYFTELRLEALSTKGKLTLPVPIPDEEGKLTELFIFKLLCGVSKVLLKALKAFINHFEVSQRSVKIKI